MSLTVKERNLLKGAIRRVFSRSELRLSVLKEAEIAHYDPERPRVTKWCRCSECGQPVARYQAEVDHVDPIIPVDRSLESMTWDEVIARVFCQRENLTVLDKMCHAIKTKKEAKQRAINKKMLKMQGSKAPSS